MGQSCGGCYKLITYESSLNNRFHTKIVLHFMIKSTNFSAVQSDLPRVSKIEQPQLAPSFYLFVQAGRRLWEPNGSSIQDDLLILFVAL